MLAEQPAKITSDEPTNTEKMRGLRWGVAEVAANTVFVQFTYFGAVFILFLNELELNKAQIGLLLSFFPFFGVVALFVAPRVARFGYKRTFIWFWTIRKFITALLLLVPWVLNEFGPQVTLLFIGLIVMGFGLCRAIAEVGYYPWNQEFVPPSLRGRYSATTNLFSNIVGIISIAIASLVIDRLTGLDRFMLLFGVGVLFGLLGVWFMSHVPGGAPVREASNTGTSHRDMLITLHDKNFWLFVLSLGLVILATTPMFSFLPLFMKEEVGLSDANVVLLQNGTLAGALVATLLVGWSADRYGSKPVMLSGLALILVLPVIWLFIPKHSSLSLPIALGAAVLQGVSTLAWSIGYGRLLFVNVVPAERKAPYMAVYYAMIGIIGGSSQLFGGYFLNLTSGFSGEIFSYTYNPFTPVFVLAFVLVMASGFLFRYVRSDTSVSSRQFAGMFIRGNPILAFESMLGYYRAKDERTTVTMTERLGHAHSPLTVDELLEALIDPRFNVRFEAIVSIARTNPDPRFVEALGNILHGTELSLSSVSAWALGRIGDNRARDSLRLGLESEYRSIRAHCARSLGTLGDQTVVPLFLERIETETDKGLQMAYASALGVLGIKEAVGPLLELLDQIQNDGARMELGLSLARITGEENAFIRLLRQVRRDPGMATAQTLATVKRRFPGITTQEGSFETCIDLWSHNRIDEGAVELAGLVRALLAQRTFEPSQRQILAYCAERLAEEKYQHPEYVILVLYILGQANGAL